MTMEPVISHPWDVSTKEAKEIQRRLRERVLVQPLYRDPKIVAGVDVSVKNNLSRAAVVLLSYPNLVPFQAVTAEMPATFPYVPGLLAFREGTVVLAAMEKLTERPDVLIFDA